jgi:hypothetical protein
MPLKSTFMDQWLGGPLGGLRSRTTLIGDGLSLLGHCSGGSFFDLRPMD